MLFSNAYICGYYGMRNTGDDALLLASYWGANHFLGAKNIRVSTPERLLLNNKMIHSNLALPQKYRGQNRLNHYKSAALSKRIIFGGGSVLHNAHDINMKRDMMRLAGRHDHLALGVGIGPFPNTKGETACKHFLNECGFVGVRDHKSFALAKSLAPHANIHKTFDLAPSLLASPHYTPRSVRRSGIAFCLCPLESLTGDIKNEHYRLSEIARVICELYEETKEPITLMDFNGHKELGDSQIHQELLRFIPTNIAINHIHYNSNPIAALKKIGSFKAVVGMRLHASVFSYLTETPLVSINYHSKCSEWCKQIGLDNNQQFQATHFNSEELSQCLRNGIKHGFSPTSLKIKTAINQSLMNWSISHEQLEHTNIRCHSPL